MDYWFDIVDTILIFSIFGISLNLLIGYAGQISVAHAAFGAVGGYTAAYISINHGYPFLLTVVLGVAMAFAVGVLVSLPALRLGTEYLILLTVAVSSIVLATAEAVPQLGGTYGLLGTETPTSKPFGDHEFLTPGDWIILFLILTVLVYLTCRRMGESAYGRVLRGIREDEVATRSLGKNVFSYKIAVFGITAGMAGLAGALLFWYNSVASPDVYGFDVSLTIFAMVIFGGMGNLTGSILGAAVLVLLRPLLEKVVNMDPGQAALTRLAIYGGGLVLLMMLRPQGLLPEGTTLISLLRSLLPSRLRSRIPKIGLSLREANVRLAVAGVATGSGLEIVEATPPVVEHRFAPSVGTMTSPAGAEREREKASGAAAADGHIVEVRGLSRRFGGIVAANDLSFDLQRGLITALVGPNGAGKTTVFNLITGAIRPNAGSVRLRGVEIVGKRPDQVARLGMVRSFQDVRVFVRLSALQNVMMGVQSQAGEHLAPLFFTPYGANRVERETRDAAMEWLGFVGLTDAAATPVGTMAFGQQKLVALARALATKAEVLLLDEPASGIDSRWVDTMLSLVADLRTQGKTVCIVEHNLHVVERLADTVLFMELGRLTAQGRIEELTRNERLAEAYFGTA